MRTTPPLWVYYVAVRYSQNGQERRFHVAAPNRLEALKCFFGPDETERSFAKRWARWGGAGVVSFDIPAYTDAWVRCLRNPGVVFDPRNRRALRSTKSLPKQFPQRPWARAVNPVFCVAAENPLRREPVRKEPPHA